MAATAPSVANLNTCLLVLHMQIHKDVCGLYRGFCTSVLFILMFISITQNGNSALIIAVREGRTEVVSLLLEAGINTELQNKVKCPWYTVCTEGFELFVNPQLACTVRVTVVGCAQYVVGFVCPGMANFHACVFLILHMQLGMCVVFAEGFCTLVLSILSLSIFIPKLHCSICTLLAILCITFTTVRKSVSYYVWWETT